MIIPLEEIAAVALYVETGLRLEDCRKQVARRAVFFSMMRCPHARALIVMLARTQSPPSSWERASGGSE